MDDNITDDVVNIDDELMKTKDYIKRDKIKNTYITKISKISINEKYDYNFISNQNYYYLTNSIVRKLLIKAK